MFSYEFSNIFKNTVLQSTSGRLPLNKLSFILQSYFINYSV